MKLLNLMVVVILFCFSPSALPTDANGRFTIVSVDSLKLKVKFQINTNTGTDDLGGATIVFDFDTTAISFTNTPIKNVDYIFHNFCDGNYSSATITRPMRNKIWVNIDLPFINNNNGTVVAVSPGWTDVVTIHFNIVDTNGTASLTWLTTSPFWGIYDANNTNLWQTGVFEDLFGPLPVELVSFAADVKDSKVQLSWQTATEINNYGFEIERRIDKDEWSNIGFIEGHGNSSSPKSYSFIDNSPLGGNKFQYRLKQIDNDGQFEYSDVVEVDVIPNQFELSQNYPNPFNPSTKIRYSIPSSVKGQSIKVILKVYDILGNEVATLVDEEKGPGIYEVEFSTIGLASGIYIYRIESTEFMDTKKMVLLR